MSRSATAALALLAAVASPGIAEAASWTKPFAITDPHGYTIYLSDVAAGPRGEVAAIGETYSKPDGLVLYSSDHRGPFAGEEVNDSGDEGPPLCFDRRGATVVLSSRMDFGNVMRAYTRPRGGHVGHEEILDRRPGSPYGISTSPTGEVFAYWTGTDLEGTADGGVRVAIRPARGDRFGPVQDLSPPSAGAIAIVFDRHGNALMTWEVDGRLEYAIRHPGGSFGPPRVLASPTDAFAGYYDIAANRAGRTIAVWRAHPGKRNAMRAAFGSVAGGFGGSKRFGGRANRGPYLAVDRSGEAVVAWRAPTKKSYVLRAAVAPAGSARFGASRVLADGYVDQIGVAADRHGTATVAWLDGSKVRAARHRSSRRGFAREVVADGPARGMTMGTTADGRTVLVSRTFKKHVEAAVANPGHGFGHVTDIGDVQRGESLEGPGIAAGGDGGAFVWWGHYREEPRETIWFEGSYLLPRR